MTNSIQVSLYSAFYDTIVAKQVYRKLSFYNIDVNPVAETEKQIETELV